VRQVGVHGDEHVGAVGQRPREAGAVGVTEAGLGLASQHRDAAEVGVDLLGQFGGAVGAVVVDHEHVGVGCGGAHAPQHRVDIRRFVVRGDEDERAH
jgi:hypothetical protein